MFLTRA